MILYDGNGTTIMDDSGYLRTDDPIKATAFQDYPLRLRFQAHRGLSTLFPENTALALNEAKKAGYDSVEIDPRITSDGVVVLCHDTTINRTGRMPDGSTIATTTAVSDVTYESLLAYDFGAYKGYPGEKIITAEEALILCKKIGLYPRFDGYFKAFTAEQRNEFYHLVKRTGMGRFVGFNCGTDTQIATEILAVLPDAEIHFDHISTIYENVSGMVGNKENVVMWINASGDLSNVMTSVESIHAQGFRCGFWTINDQAAATTVIEEYYADIVESDGGIDPLLYIRNNLI